MCYMQSDASVRFHHYLPGASFSMIHFPLSAPQQLEVLLVHILSHEPEIKSQKALRVDSVALVKYLLDF